MTEPPSPLRMLLSRHTKRRAFVTLLGAAGGGVAAFRARAAGRGRRSAAIGVLWHAGSAEEEGSNFKALVKGFTDLGYIEGRMIILEHRFPTRCPTGSGAWPPNWCRQGSMS